MPLKKLRNSIDRIDEKIVALLNQRAAEVIKVSRLKAKKSLTVYAAEREAALLARLKRISKGPFGAQDVENVFREILSACRSQRFNLKIAYLGPQGTFTHLASINKFGKKPEYLPSESISDVFDKVQRGEADYGVVPVENSTEGVVNYTLDMFFDSSLNICSEATLNISHCLLSKGKSKIKKVYSNPQVFAQCRSWMSKHLPGAELIPAASTAKAALQAKKEPAAGCIGNKILANLYGLKVIASGIEDSSSNYTRFLVIAKNDSLASGDDKTSILLSVKDEVGALFGILASFKSYGINLTKIESRPSKKKPWEYYFFVDIQGHRSSPAIKKAVKKLSKDCIFIKILGSYPREK